jgi:glucosamine-6-phosphate deaminase
MTFLDALAEIEGIEWHRVICFNVDEFYDENMPEKFTCGFQTTSQLYSRVNPGQIHLLKHDAADPYEEAHRFEKLMREKGGLDILCQGIGTSGHLAFNEPSIADFQDPDLIKVIEICEQSKKQLRDDPNFRELGYIPHKGITMTIPALMSAPYRFTMVPLALKKPIMTKLFEYSEPVKELPATILLEYEGRLYVDKDSCPKKG